MIDDGIKGGQADMALTDFLVAVFMAGQFVLTVVNVNGLQPIEADDLIEGQEDVVELMDDVVAAVKDVAKMLLCSTKLSSRRRRSSAMA